MRSLTGGVCIKLLTKLCHNQRSPLARLHIRYHKPIGIRCTASVLGTMREDTLRDYATSWVTWLGQPAFASASMPTAEQICPGVQ